jgi:putative transposase
MPFRVCYYHVIWATKHRLPLITPEMEPVIFAAIKHKSSALKSPVLAISGVADHVHVAVSISTNIAVAEWVKQVKGVSTYEVNTSFALSDHFRWQRGYGILTFGAKTLPFVQTYIARQKDHHRDGTTEDYLERLAE